MAEGYNQLAVPCTVVTVVSTHTWNSSKRCMDGVVRYNAQTPEMVLRAVHAAWIATWCMGLPARFPL